MGAVAHGIVPEVPEALGSMGSVEICKDLNKLERPALRGCSAC